MEVTMKEYVPWKIENHKNAQKTLRVFWKQKAYTQPEGVHAPSV